MATKIGVGESMEKGSLTAGAQAARAALEKAGIKECDFVLLFATVGYNQEELLKGVRSVTGTALISGCSGEGVITQQGPAGESVFTRSGLVVGSDIVAVMAIASDELSFFGCCSSGLKDDSFGVGKAIGKAINGARNDESFMLLMFPDGMTVNTKKFFDGIEKTAKGPIPFCGGTAGDTMSFTRTYQYFNDRVLTDSASCVLVSGPVHLLVGISHGCIPIGLEKTVTRAKANRIYEIDDKPAWEFFKPYLEDDMVSNNKFTFEASTVLGLGEKVPDDIATEYDKYIIRAPLGQNSDGSLYIPTEIPVGTKIQMTRRDPEKISLNAKKTAERIRDNLKGRKPAFILHFDCCHRGKNFFGDELKTKGIDVMQDVFGKDIPWLGFFTYGEIGPIRGKNYFHNSTAVLCVVY